MGMGKDKLVYVTGDVTQGDSVAAFLHATLALTSTTIGGIEALDVNIASPLSVTVDLDGDYDVSTNPTPDTVGTILRTRGATPGLADQNESLTGAAASSDAVVAANAHGMDSNAFGMIFNGTTWDRMRGTSGALNVIPLGGIADDGVDSGNPIKVGSRAVSGALTAVSTTGDRADLLSDLYRRVWVNTAPNVAGSNAAVTVDDTVGGVALFASPLAGRRIVEIQNLGSKEIYMGFGTVTTANGVRISGGATYQTELGPDLALKAIAGTGNTVNCRVLQLA